MEIENRTLNGVTLNASDVAGSTKFQDVSLTAGVETDIGEFIVPTDSVGATWGGIGTMFCALFDDTTTAVREEGIYRFYTANTMGRRAKVFESRSEVVGPAGQISDPSKQNIMPRGNLKALAPAGGKLIMTFESDATDIIDTSDSTITQLPITIVRR